MLCVLTLDNYTLLVIVDNLKRWLELLFREGGGVGCQLQPSSKTTNAW